MRVEDVIQLHFQLRGLTADPTGNLGSGLPVRLTDFAVVLQGVGGIDGDIVSVIHRPSGDHEASVGGLTHVLQDCRASTVVGVLNVPGSGQERVADPGVRDLALAEKNQIQVIEREWPAVLLENDLAIDHVDDTAGTLPRRPLVIGVDEGCLRRSTARSTQENASVPRREHGFGIGRRGPIEVISLLDLLGRKAGAAHPPSGIQDVLGARLQGELINTHGGEANAAQWDGNVRHGVNQVVLPHIGVPIDRNGGSAAEQGLKDGHLADVLPVVLLLFTEENLLLEAHTPHRHVVHARGLDLPNQFRTSETSKETACTRAKFINSNARTSFSFVRIIKLLDDIAGKIPPNPLVTGVVGAVHPVVAPLLDQILIGGRPLADDFFCVRWRPGLLLHGATPSEGERQPL